MKAFERIFLYSVLALLVCYVFLVDGNVEIKEIKQTINELRVDIAKNQ